jgi:hypothetical protein
MSNGNAIDLTGWTLNQLRIQLPSNCTTDFTLAINATSLEQSNASTATTRQSVLVKVLSGTPAATPATANPWVRAVNPLADSATSNTALLRQGATLMVSGLNVGAVNANTSQLASTNSQEFLHSRAEALAAAWLRELERL